MIRYVRGNILEAPTEALVNTVNCVGVMGRGIALQFRNAFPENYKAYVAACAREEVQPGRMFVHETGGLTYPRYVINFPTKRHWRGKSRLEDIQAGLDALVTEIQERQIRSIAVPALGSGLGGLAWGQVRPLIENAMASLPGVEVHVYEPVGAHPESDTRSRVQSTKMTAGRAALAGLMNRYLSALMDPSISLLEVHKLMYFLQEAGEPLDLRYVKAHYGPYAENLRHVLRDIEGNLVEGYASNGDAPDTRLTLRPGAVERAETFLMTQNETHKRFDRVGRVVTGYETPFGLELLATIHWVATHEGAESVDGVVAATHAWGSRKRQFSATQIESAAHHLQSDGWMRLDNGDRGLPTAFSH